MKYADSIEMAALFCAVDDNLSIALHACYPAQLTISTCHIAIPLRRLITINKTLNVDTCDPTERKTNAYSLFL